MKRIFLLALVIMTIFLQPPHAAAAEAVELNDVIRALDEPFGKAAKGIADFQADFVQESNIASLDRVQRGGGRVTVKFDRSGKASSAKFRWQYDQPTPQEIVSNGKTIWVFLPENRQVIQTEIDPSAESQPDNPLSFLTGLGNLSRDFQIGWGDPKQDAKGNYLLELRPRKPSAMIQRLLVAVERGAVDAARRGKIGGVFPIRSTTIYDPSENSTAIEFRNVRINQSVTNSFFNFKIPEGVEVVRPEGQGMGF